MQRAHLQLARSSHPNREPDILICLLGTFQVLKRGQAVEMRGGKSQALLVNLATQSRGALERERLLHLLWPDSDGALAGQALSSLVSALRRVLGDAIGGAPPILCMGGAYRLNLEAGVAVDIPRFDAFVLNGEAKLRAGDSAGAVDEFLDAMRLYRGDLCMLGEDIHALVERERLRAAYLMLLSRLADHAFDCADLGACVEYAVSLLNADPCREDGHRLLMRCYVGRGERAQALRQYQVCRAILKTQFDAEPERATQALFEQIRVHPEESLPR